MAHVAVCRRPVSRPRLEVADVFRAFGQAYRASHALSSEQAKVFDAILACRTVTLGGHLDVCKECGFEQPAYNSCRDRHCPKCQSLAAARWVEARKKSLLPVHYFHVVFTLPAEMRPLALRNRQALFNLLFETVSQTLLTIGADPRHLGALLGLTAVLHTWTRDLSFHPHLHCIVCGGGLAPDGQGWIPTLDGYLFPVNVLGQLFRGKFLAGLKRLYNTGSLNLGGVCADLAARDVFQALLDKLYGKQWLPYAKRTFAGPEQVYDYLGYYTHRVGISSHRLLEVTSESVHFKTKNGKTATLTGEEFIRRFLLHVLPSGFVKIRHYGLLAAKAQAKRQAVRAALATSETEAVSESEAPDQATAEPQPDQAIARLLEIAVLCPRCAKPALVRRPLRDRAPPDFRPRSQYP
jgi:hypothetical protein